MLHLSNNINIPGTHLAIHKLFREKKIKRETIRSRELFKYDIPEGSPDLL